MTRRSTCILLILGMLSFCSLTPGSISGTACSEACAWASFNSCSISRTNVACSSRICRSSAPRAARRPCRGRRFTSSSTLARLALVLGPAVELGEHLVGVVDRSDRLVGAGVDHAGPGVGPVGDHHAELQRAEPRARLGRIGLEERLDLLVDRLARSPSRPGCRTRPGCCRGKSSTPVSRQPMPRMWLSPSPRSLSHTPWRIEGLVLERLQRLEDRLQRRSPSPPRPARMRRGSRRRG